MGELLERALEIVMACVLFVTFVFLTGSLGDGRGRAAKLGLFRLFFFHFLPKQERYVRAHGALLLLCAALKKILHA